VVVAVAVADVAADERQRVVEQRAVALGDGAQVVEEDTAKRSISQAPIVVSLSRFSGRSWWWLISWWAPLGRR
jgi:hypothetical protein